MVGELCAIGVIVFITYVNYRCITFVNVVVFVVDAVDWRPDFWWVFFVCSRLVVIHQGVGMECGL